MVLLKKDIWFKMEKLIDNYIERYQSEFTKWREELHQFPELSWHENKTSAYIKEKLDAWGLKYKSVGTGLFGDIHFSKTGKHIGYRADIDALPLQDLKNVDYKSKNNGACHSCGHDFHTASLLATIQVLLELKHELKGSFRFIFQAAEEVLPGGSLEMIKAGALEKLDCLLAMHAEPSLELGEVSISPDWVTTETVNYYISVHGEGGHSARPYETIDPIFVSSQLISNIYTRIDRYKKYNEFFVFTVTRIHSGDRLNVIPDLCELGASLRLTNSKNKKEIMLFIDSAIKDIAESNGANAEIKHEFGNPAVVNNENLAKEIKSLLEKKKLFKAIHSDVKTMGSEDFSNYQEHLATCYIRFGVSNKNLKYGLHNALFDIDKGSVPLACKMFTNIVSAFLE
jgi:amidohydrolase